MKEKDKFFEILKNEKYGLYPASTNAQLALNTISEYVLGEDYYVVDPIHNEQVNTILTHDILYKISKKYRKDFKKFKKESLKIKNFLSSICKQY